MYYLITGYILLFNLKLTPKVAYGTENVMQITRKIGMSLDQGQVRDGLQLQLICQLWMFLG